MRDADVDLMALTELVGRIFPPQGRCRIERTLGGVSTPVYRIQRGAEVFYLRLAEDRAASLAPEVYVHEALRARGVRVPAVVHFEPFAERLGRSVMVTTEIAGEPVGHGSVDGATREVLRAAGRDLAAVNSMPVRGFGWIKREHGTRSAGHLEAEAGSYRSVALAHVADDLALLSQEMLTGAEVDAIRRVIDRYAGWLEVAQGQLAHGDFDLTHIYQHDGRYSGIIDFGEIRGADRLYDLGHFNLHDGETLPQLVLPSLLEGYGEVVPLPPDHERRISLASVLIGVRAMVRTAGRPQAHAYRQQLAVAMRRAVGLLSG